MTAQDPSPSGRPSWRGLVAVAAVVAAVLGAVALLSGGGNALDDAAASVAGKSVRMRFDVQVLGAGDTSRCRAMAPSPRTGRAGWPRSRTPRATTSRSRSRCG